MQIGFSLSLTRRARSGGADSGAISAPYIWTESGYGGTVIQSTAGGIWYVNGVVSGAGPRYTVRPQDEGLPIWQTTSPAVWIASGSGYAGTVYESNVVGQWRANGVDIPGAVGSSWTMTPQYEGAAIDVELRVLIHVDQGSGYAGSVYRSNFAGQWQADGVDIPGATGPLWTMTPQYEGAAINLDRRVVIWLEEGSGYAGSRLKSNAVGQWSVGSVPIGSASDAYVVRPQDEGLPISIDATLTAIADLPEYNMQSNVIQMFAPVTLTAAQKSNGGQWGADIQTTATRDGVEYVTAWPDRFGVRNMSQSVAVEQPRAITVNGIQAAQWPAGAMTNHGLTPPANFAAKWWFVLATYKGGAATFSDHNTLILGAANVTNARFSGVAFTANMDAAGMTNIRRNGAAVLTTGHLPLSVCSISGTTALADPNRPWAIGRAWNPADSVRKRDWEGEIYGVLALAEEPDEATRQKIEGYYHWKYGVQSMLPAGHPYRSAPPRIQ